MALYPVVNTYLAVSFLFRMIVCKTFSFSNLLLGECFSNNTLANASSTFADRIDLNMIDDILKGSELTIN